MVSGDVKNFSADCNDHELITREISIGEAIGANIGVIDYDKAATSLFDMAAAEARQGHYSNASEFMKRALFYTVDDSCLVNREWPSYHSDNVEWNIMNAAGLFYNGRKEQAEFILTGYGHALDSNLDALYILSRCFEDRQDWKNVKDTYHKMLSIQQQYIEVGQDSPSFRKMRYRLAILNESVFHDSGAGMIRQLITENPMYDKYHIAMRWMLESNEEAVSSASEKGTENNVISMMFDKDVSDEQYIESLSSERAASSNLWKGYRSFLRNLGLAMPY